MAQVLYLLLEKFAFTELRVQLVLSEGLQYYPEMLLMLFHSPRVNQYIVNKDQHKFIQILVEHTVHQAHKCGRALVNPKGNTTNS